MLTITESQTVEIEFSVYCGICGHGCCSDTEVDRKNNITMTCPKCQDRIAELEGEIDALQSEIDNLQDELKEKEGK